MDPGRNGKELSKSPIEDNTQKNDSGTVDQEDIGSHDNYMIAYESKESDSSPIETASSDAVTENVEVTDENETEPDIEWNHEGLLEVGHRLNLLGVHCYIK